MKLYGSWKALCLGVACAWLSLGSVSFADTPFYQGKRLTLLVNFGVGGSTDIQGRLYVKYLAKYLPGKPTIIVQNMEGGGGMSAANYLAEVAANDGLTLGYFSGTAWAGVTDAKRFKVDYKTYEFVAYEPGTTIYFARTDVPPGLKKATDIVKGQNLVMGGIGASSDKDLRHRLTLDMLGVPYRYVAGYQSSAQARHALERGEIQFYSEAPGTYISQVVPNLVKSGVVLPLYYDPRYDGEQFSAPRAVADVDIMSFPDLYKKIKGEMPSGQAWDAYLAMITVTAAMQRVIVLPPNAPRGALDALRSATAKLNSDKEMEAEALKVVGIRPEFVTGPDTSEQVRRALAVDPKIVAFIENYRTNVRKP
jgi:tripartite-type tricarboxylate transporter receptor subunit TctC